MRRSKMLFALSCPVVSLALLFGFSPPRLLTAASADSPKADTAKSADAKPAETKPADAKPNNPAPNAAAQNEPKTIKLRLTPVPPPYDALESRFRRYLERTSGNAARCT